MDGITIVVLAVIIMVFTVTVKQALDIPVVMVG